LTLYAESWNLPCWRGTSVSFLPFAVNAPKQKERFWLDRPFALKAISGRERFRLAGVLPGAGELANGVECLCKRRRFHSHLSFNWASN
jgi:hypothetical protein